MWIIDLSSTKSHLSCYAVYQQWVSSAEQYPATLRASGGWLSSVFQKKVNVSVPFLEASPLLVRKL